MRNVLSFGSSHKLGQNFYLEMMIISLVNRETQSGDIRTGRTYEYEFLYHFWGYQLKNQLLEVDRWKE